MSKRTIALHDARQAALAAGGSHATQEARVQTMQRIVQACYDRGQQVNGTKSLKERHIVAYVREQQDAGKSSRTLQNELAHIRGTLRATGRDGLAGSHGINNKALGISGACRDGTKTAITDEQYRATLDKAGKIDAGLQAVLRLERVLGLRAKEAIRSPASLATWQRQLENNQRITIVYGTKGGRPRDSLPADRQRALDAVCTARQIADQRNGRLIDRPTLREAQTVYRHAMNRHLRIQGHALRYAYTRERVSAYLRDGYSRKEAFALTSMDLGHGDGRGRWLERVYMR